MIDHYGTSIAKLVEVWVDYMEACDGGCPTYRKERDRKIRERGSPRMQWENDWPTSWLRECRLGSAAESVPFARNQISLLIQVRYH